MTWTSLKATKDWAGLDKVAFFSQFRGMQVIDCDGCLVGKLKDCNRAGRDAARESIRDRLLTTPLGRRVHRPQVGCLVPSTGIIKLTVAKADIPPGKLSGKEMLVTDTLLDKQIVDITASRWYVSTTCSWPRSRTSYAWPAWMWASTAFSGAWGCCGSGAVKRHAFA